MSRGPVTVNLTRAEALRLLDSLNAHFAGDTSVGDLAWTSSQHRDAECARQAIEQALDTRVAKAVARKQLNLKRKQDRLRELLTWNVYSDAPECAEAVAEILKLKEVIGQ